MNVKSALKEELCLKAVQIGHTAFSSKDNVTLTKSKVVLMSTVIDAGHLRAFQEFCNITLL